jgi:hypothetical protein
LKTKLLAARFGNNLIVLENKSDRNLDRRERMKLVLSSAQNRTVALLRDAVEMYLRLGFEAGKKRELFLFVRGKERK